MLSKNGVSTQNAELLPLDPGKEMPTPIVLDLEKNRRAQREHLVQQRREKARLVLLVLGCVPRRRNLTSV